MCSMLATGMVATCTSRCLYLWTINGDLIAQTHIAGSESEASLDVTFSKGPDYLDALLLTGHADGRISFWATTLLGSEGSEHKERIRLERLREQQTLARHLSTPQRSSSFSHNTTLSELTFVIEEDEDEDEDNETEKKQEPEAQDESQEQLSEVGEVDAAKSSSLLPLASSSNVVDEQDQDQVQTTLAETETETSSLPRISSSSSSKSAGDTPPLPVSVSALEDIAVAAMDAAEAKSDQAEPGAEEQEKDDPIQDLEMFGREYGQPYMCLTLEHEV